MQALHRSVAALAFGLALLGMAAPADAALVAHWPFDGNANDASGNGHTGTPTGTVAYSGSVPGTLSMISSTLEASPHCSGAFVEVPPMNSPGIGPMGATSPTTNTIARTAGKAWARSFASLSRRRSWASRQVA